MRMSHNGNSWLKRVAACVHQDARDPRKAERYRAMIREWAGEMVQNARPSTVSVREKLKRVPYGWTDEQIEEHLRLYDKVLPDGTTNRAENPEVIQYDPISFTMHSATPLNKKYAQLAAIHDASEHCDFPIDPWAGRSPAREPLSDEERHEAYSAMKYARLKQCAAELTDDDQVNVERMLADVAAELDEVPAGESKAPKKPRGRRALADPAVDAKLYDAWKNRGVRTYAEGVNLLHSMFPDLTEEELRAALDRHRKRELGSN